MSTTTIHWGRILLGGLLAEVALILAIVPLGLRLGDDFLHYTAPPGSFVMCLLGALWVCRRIESHFILHGTLVGVVAALIYVALTRAQPEPFAYLLAHALKLAGGACGGFVAPTRRPPKQPELSWGSNPALSALSARIRALVPFSIISAASNSPKAKRPESPALFCQS